MGGLMALMLILYPAFKKSCSACHIAPPLLNVSGIETFYSTPDTAEFKKNYYFSLYLASVDYSGGEDDSLELSLPHRYRFSYIPHFQNGRCKVDIATSGKRLELEELYTDFGFGDYSIRVGRFYLFPHKGMYTFEPSPLYARNIFIDGKFLRELYEGISVRKVGELSGEIAVLNAKKIDEVDFFMRVLKFFDEVVLSLSTLHARGNKTTDFIILEGIYSHDNLSGVLSLMGGGDYTGLEGELRYRFPLIYFLAGGSVINIDDSSKTSFRLGFMLPYRELFDLTGRVGIYDLKPLSHRIELVAHLFF